MPSDEYQWTIDIREQLCENYIDKESCELAECYWYNDSCHTNPQPHLPWIPIIVGVAIAATAVGGYIVWKK